MEAKHSIERAVQFIKKYRFVSIVIIVGIILMLLPSGTSQKEEIETPKQIASEPSMESRLTKILMQIQGAGKVSVMLTIAAGEETIFQEDQNGSGQKDTVTVTDKDRGQNGLIVQILPPRYQGALIVCQGADDPQVRLAITNAVSNLIGIGTDKVTIVKMK